MSSVDIYGESIKLTYKGQDTFKTPLGTFFSILILLLMTSYTIYRFIILVNRIDPNVSYQSFLRDLNSAGEYQPYKDD